MRFLILFLFVPQIDAFTVKSILHVDKVDGENIFQCAVLDEIGITSIQNLNEDELLTSNGGFAAWEEFDDAGDNFMCAHKPSLAQKN